MCPLEAKQLIVLSFLCSVEGLSVSEKLVLPIVVRVVSVQEETCDVLGRRDVGGGRGRRLGQEEQEPED